MSCAYSDNSQGPSAGWTWPLLTKYRSTPVTLSQSILQAKSKSHLCQGEPRTDPVGWVRSSHQAHTAYRHTRIASLASMNLQCIFPHTAKVVILCSIFHSLDKNIAICYLALSSMDIYPNLSQLNWPNLSASSCGGFLMAHLASHQEKPGAVHFVPSTPQGNIFTVFTKQKMFTAFISSGCLHTPHLQEPDIIRRSLSSSWGQKPINCFQMNSPKWDSWGWVWFKPDLILYQKMDFILSIYCGKGVLLPFKLQPHGKISCRMAFPKEKRVLLKHLKVMGKCIASRTFL